MTRDHINHLIDKLLSDDLRVSESAASTLVKSGREVVPTLIAALDNAIQCCDWSACWVIPKVFEEIGPAAKEAAPTLSRLIESDPIRDLPRISAIRALAKIDPVVAFSVTAKELPFCDYDDEVQREVPHLLAKLDPHGAIPALIETFPYLSIFGKESAARALVDVGCSAIPTLLAALKRRDYETSGFYLIQALSDLGAPREAIPELIIASRADDEIVRCCAVEALGKIRPTSNEIARALIEALADPWREVQVEAMEALHITGPEVIPALTEALRTCRSEKVRERLIYVLAEFRKAARGAVPSLLDTLKNEDDRICSSAIYALCDIAEGDSEIAPHLVTLFKASRCDLAVLDVLERFLPVDSAQTETRRLFMEMHVLSKNPEATFCLFDSTTSMQGIIDQVVRNIRRKGHCRDNVDSQKDDVRRLLYEELHRNPTLRTSRHDIDNFESHTKRLLTWLLSNEYGAFYGFRRKRQTLSGENEFIFQQRSDLSVSVAQLVEARDEIGKIYDHIREKYGLTGLNVLILKLEGHSYQEIMLRTCLTFNQVHKSLQIIRKTLQVQFGVTDII